MHGVCMVCMRMVMMSVVESRKVRMVGAWWAHGVHAHGGDEHGRIHEGAHGGGLVGAWCSCTSWQ